MLYNLRIYRIDKENRKKFLGYGVVNKTLFGHCYDSVSNFLYTELTEEDGKILGGRPEIMSACGMDIGIFKKDIVKKNQATQNQIEDYVELFPLTPIYEMQDLINMDLNFAKNNKQL